MNQTTETTEAYRVVAYYRAAFREGRPPAGSSHHGSLKQAREMAQEEAQLESTQRAEIHRNTPDGWRFVESLDGEYAD